MTVVAETTQTPSSSSIASFSYDPDVENLTVEFRSGESYVYFNVPTAVYRAMQLAASPGKFFYAKIRNGGYAYEQQ